MVRRIEAYFAQNHRPNRARLPAQEILNQLIANAVRVCKCAHAPVFHTEFGFNLLLVKATP